MYGWINAGQAVWHHQPPEETLRGRKTNSDQKPQWEKLAEKVGQLAKTAEVGGIRGELVGEWLWRLAYFLSPAVSGVTPDVVKAFAAQVQLTREWEKSRDMIEGYHEEIINFLVEKKMNTLAKQLSHAMDDHLKALIPTDGSPPSR